MGLIKKLQGGGEKILAQVKSVTAGTSATTVTPDDGYLLESVIVNPTPSETKTVTPKVSSQSVTPSSGKLLSKVTVNGDSNLVAENILEGKSIFGVVGTAVQGATGIAYGTVTAGTSSSLSVTHGLGAKPTHYGLILLEQNCSSLYFVRMIFDDYSVWYDSITSETLSSSGTETTVTTSKITFKPSEQCAVGVGFGNKNVFWWFAAL